MGGDLLHERGRPARRFDEAMGGQEIGQRTFDEEGYLLPMVVYAWPDIGALIRGLKARS